MASTSDPRDDDRYPVVHHAARDALWSVLGAVAALVFILVVVFLGLGLLGYSLFVASPSTTPVAFTLGFVLTFTGLLQLLRSSGVLPSVAALRNHV